MFGLTFPEFVGLCVGLISIFTAIVGGIIWLIKTLMSNAMTKGENQAKEIKDDIEDMGSSFINSLTLMTDNLATQIKSNDTASRDRGKALSKRLDDHNENVSDKLTELKEQQGRQLEFIRDVNDDAKKNKELISKVSNKVSKIEGRLSRETA